MTTTPTRPALTLRASTLARATTVLRLVTCDPSAALTGTPDAPQPVTGSGQPMINVQVAGDDLDGYTLTFIHTRKP